LLNANYYRERNAIFAWAKAAVKSGIQLMSTAINTGILEIA